MYKTKLNKLYYNENFKTTETKDKTTFTYNDELQPQITIDNNEYTTIKPVKQIIIIKNHILQSNEIELKDKNNQILLHINLGGSNIEDITIKYTPKR